MLLKYNRNFKRNKNIFFVFELNKFINLHSRNGMWRSRLARCVRDAEAASSNLAIPTKSLEKLRNNEFVTRLQEIFGHNQDKDFT